MEFIKIALTPEIVRALSDRARKQGTTPEKLAFDYLRERFPLSDTAGGVAGGQGTLADFLANHIGVLSSSECIPGGARMSENCGRTFTAGLIKKRREGRL